MLTSSSCTLTRRLLKGPFATKADKAISATFRLFLEVARESMPRHGPLGIIVKDVVGLFGAFGGPTAVNPRHSSNGKPEILIDAVTQLKRKALEVVRRPLFESSGCRADNGVSCGIGRSIHIVCSFFEVDVQLFDELWRLGTGSGRWGSGNGWESGSGWKEWKWVVVIAGYGLI
jgi:hypothetical protein